MALRRARGINIADWKHCFARLSLFNHTNVHFVYFFVFKITCVFGYFVVYKITFSFQILFGYFLCIFCTFCIIFVYLLYTFVYKITSIFWILFVYKFPYAFCILLYTKLHVHFRYKIRCIHEQFVALMYSMLPLANVYLAYIYSSPIQAGRQTNCIRVSYVMPDLFTERCVNPACR